LFGCVVAFCANVLVADLGVCRADEGDDKKPVAESQDEKPNNKKKNRKKKSADDTGKRLDAIEKALQQLATDMKALRQSSTGETDVDDEQQEPKAEPKKEPVPVSMKLESQWLKDVPWRSIGPANMGGRITDIVVHDEDPSLWWIATASGGLLKTKNQGVTVEHQFDREATVSIGCIAADPKNKEVLWVGTGEVNPRNSVSYGDGVYKSVDGGKSWKNMGLKRSYQISRILIDPFDTDTVYVGVQGRLYGTSSERGVYKTTDGGKSWVKALYVDDRAGVIDMIMHPEDPNTIIAAFWDRLRDGFDSWPGSEKRPEGNDGYDPIRKWGPGGGLYKTTDGGANWKKLSVGLPTSMTGRIGMDWQTKSPHAIYAIIDCEDIGKGPKRFIAFLGAVGRDIDGQATITQLLPESPAEKDGIKVGDVLRKIDGEDVGVFDELLDVLREKKVGDKVTLALRRGDEDVTVETKLTGRPGTSQRRAAPSVWLGVTGADQEGKIVLSSITEGGPSAKAGLKQGDIIAKVNDKDVADYEGLIAQVRRMSAGDKLKLQVTRGEESVEITVTLERRPGSGRQAPAQSNVFMGIRGENAETGGALLTTITDGGPSEKAGLKEGDVVLKIDGKDVADYQDLVTEIRSRKPNDTMKVAVRRGKKTVEVEVKLGDRSNTSSLRPYTYSYFGQTPNIQDQQGSKGSDYGGVYRSYDAGETWERVNSLNVRPMYFSVVRVDPSDDQRVYVLGVSQFRSINGGTTFTSDFGRGVHADGHDLWIDPKDGRHMVIGGDGGFYVTYDYGDNWDHINTAAIGQFYHVTISAKKPYWVFGGLQDNGSWSGPAISKKGGAINEDWISVSGGDGFVCRVDPNDPDLVYYESQNGRIGRRHLKTGERASIGPRRVEGVSYRFNWNTPFILSNHNSKIFYSAGNYVFRSLDRGNDLQAISPEITLTKRGSATALSESPRNPNVLYVGTDDGALWVTRDGGHQWDNITKNLGIDEPRWVATIEASRFKEGRVFVCLDAHRSDDDNPYALVSEDFGETFQPLHKDLPWGSTRCLREDLVNPNLLYLGTEFTLWVSLDRGQNWSPLGLGLPTVAIHEVAMHPSNGEIVVATHGRSLWACDVTGLRSLKPDHIAKDIAFHEPNDVIRWRSDLRRGRTNRRYIGNNPTSGAQLWYSLPSKAERVAFRIENIDGQVISELTGKGEAGLHRVSWNLTGSVQGRPAGGAGGGRPGGGVGAARPGDGRPGGGRPAGGGRTRGGRPVSNGTYRIVLVVDGKELQARTVTLVQDPSLPADSIADEQYELMLLNDELAAEIKRQAKSEGRTHYHDD
jgi:S1-C subfamily serine protease/photosystem II stability/assembly factor-like uncharacterized protein